MVHLHRHIIRYIYICIYIYIYIYMQFWLVASSSASSVVVGVIWLALLYVGVLDDVMGTSAGLLPRPSAK